MYSTVMSQQLFTYPKRLSYMHIFQQGFFFFLSADNMMTNIAKECFYCTKDDTGSCQYRSISFVVFHSKISTDISHLFALLRAAHVPCYYFQGPIHQGYAMYAEPSFRSHSSQSIGPVCHNSYCKEHGQGFKVLRAQQIT